MSVKPTRRHDVQFVKELLAKTDPHVAAFFAAGQPIEATSTEIVMGFPKSRAIAQARCEKHRAIIYQIGLVLGFDVNWRFVTLTGKDA